MDFVPGQRWISEAENDLGLGTILTLDHRLITVLYPSCGETRTYARHNHPLHRIEFSEGDKIKSHEGWFLQIAEVIHKDGLVTYTGLDDEGQTRELPESCLDNFIQFNKPRERLLAGQVDQLNQFALRFRTLNHYNRTLRSPLLGLCGARTTLIPHQLHIAREVATRHAPRVLLADEVGLGKTIEAGMILYHQLLTGEAKRVLILVPETLQHQWLVEMLRRFNLHFSLFDRARCEELSEENPFESEQLVLCSIQLAAQPGPLQQQLVDAGWDMLVVDEAHHLQWQEAAPSDEYQLVEQLASGTPSVLLLTATPEQLGKESHFARLRLLDADRYPSLAQFLEEEAQYQPVAEAVQELLGDAPLSPRTQEALSQLLNDADNQPRIEKASGAEPCSPRQQARDHLIRQLLDRHGTSRVLFRNTRAAIQGFPGRVVQDYPLELPELYSIAQQQRSQLAEHLYPERAYQQAFSEQDSDAWWRFDPRVDWLMVLLKHLKKKVLVICSQAETALELDEALRVRSGIPSAVFHDGMSIMERDRAAAYFAEEDYGAQVLICSEIGSEGRNFQFAHHLVLFDLPDNPDLLEQRIGRLDRIGQSETIRLHVPVFTNSAQHSLYRWYHEGLNAFVDTCPTGSTLFSRYADQLHALLICGTSPDSTELDSLVEQSKCQREALQQEMQQGRDRLLELNSRGLEPTQPLIESIESAAEVEALKRYLNLMLDCYGLESEEHSPQAVIVRPSDQSLLHDFPGLPRDGATMTWNRELALSREDMQFLSWEHPMVLEGMEMILASELGNTAVGLINNRGIKAGTMLVEAVYVIASPGGERNQLKRYLPPTAVRTLIDPKGNDLATKVAFDTLDTQLQPLKKATARQLINAQREPLQVALKGADNAARTQVDGIIDQACEQFRQEIADELQRLIALKAVNPNIRDSELSHLTALAREGEAKLRQSQLQLDSVRIIFAS
ncbi:RNA polymerase-associated protein RapA [Aestuariirhabdus sp. Z084]|nr:RNA polymerase-associated protein RapA [Aestuariirhabdus haliotis]MCL6417306.1 RNA polymerase-associated protein RapA [Aestuariirhabdus haliotis]MCL6421251.1 RNA polymerase-associated protein RapA [Aestuariirhabdus haliotis]